MSMNKEELRLLKLLKTEFFKISENEETAGDLQIISAQMDERYLKIFDQFDLPTGDKERVFDIFNAEMEALNDAYDQVIELIKEVPDILAVPHMERFLMWTWRGQEISVRESALISFWLGVKMMRHNKSNPEFNRILEVILNGVKIVGQQTSYEAIKRAAKHGEREAARERKGGAKQQGGQGKESKRIFDVVNLCFDLIDEAQDRGEVLPKHKAAKDVHALIVKPPLQITAERLKNILSDPKYLKRIGFVRMRRPSTP